MSIVGHVLEGHLLRFCHLSQTLHREASAITLTTAWASPVVGQSHCALWLTAPSTLCSVSSALSESRTHSKAILPLEWLKGETSIQVCCSLHLAPFQGLSREPPNQGYLARTLVSFLPVLCTARSRITCGAVLEMPITCHSSIYSFMHSFKNTQARWAKQTSLLLFWLSQSSHGDVHEIIMK